MKPKDKESLKLALSNLSKSRTIQSEKTHSTPDFGGEMDMWLDVIESRLPDKKLSDFASRDLLVRCSRMEQELDADRFLERYQIEKSAYLSEKLKEFLVVYPIAGPIDYLPKWKIKNGVRIQFKTAGRSARNRRLISERSEQRNNSTNPALFPDNITKCALAICSIKQRNPSDAVHFSEVALRSLLGIADISATYDRNETTIVGPFRPPSMFVLAPHITVHRKTSGALASSKGEFWMTGWRDWYEPRFMSKKNSEVFKRNFAAISKLCRDSSYGDFCDSLLVGYHEALSEFDPSSSFLKLWKLFERLAGADGGRTEKAILRISNQFGDSQNAELIAQYLKSTRHKMVHGEHQLSREASRLPNQLKRLIDPVLLEVISNQRGFDGIEDFWEFWDMKQWPDRELKAKNRAITEILNDRSR